MKKILITLLAAASLTACIEDKTTFPVNSVADIELAANDQADISIGYLEPFDFAPALTQGGKELDNENYTYRWEINDIPKSSDFEVIGTERELHTVLNQPINIGSYLLKLTVTDLANELEYLFAWNLYVQTAFLDGLVVSDTKDGVSSDLTLILNDRLTTNYAGKPEKIFRDIITSATGTPYPALLGSLYPYLFSSITGTHWNYLLAIDDRGNPVRFDCEDFAAEPTSNVLLYQYEGQRVQKFISAANNSATTAGLVMMTTHGNYVINPTSANQFGMPIAAFSQTAMKNNICASATYSNDGYCSAAWLDEATGRFMMMDMSGMGTPYLTLLENPAEGTPAYDAENMGDQSIIGAGMTYNEDIPAMLLKDNATGEYAIYTITPYSPEVGHYQDPDNWEGWTVDTPEQLYAPRARIALPGTVKTQLDRAVDTEFCTKQAILYIATPDALSAVLFITGNVVEGGVKFTPDAGEQITSVKLYRQGVYYYSAAMCQADMYGGETYRPLLDLTNSAVIVTTQKSDTEGFVYVVPMTQLGTGNLDRSKAMKFDGFGKILDVATTGY